MKSSGSGGGGGGDDSDDSDESDDGFGPRHHDHGEHPPRRGSRPSVGASGGDDPPGRDFSFPGGDPPPGDHFGGHDPWGYYGYPHGYPGFPGGDRGPPSGPPGPPGNPRGRFPLYIPYPYTRPKSPPILKLPGITKEQYNFGMGTLLPFSLR